MLLEADAGERLLPRRPSRREPLGAAQRKAVLPRLWNGECHHLGP